jgi:outer membrane lipopolysaccharide assembly protein LptE/RlpB
MRRRLFLFLVVAPLLLGACGYELVRDSGMVVNTSTQEGIVPITIASLYIPVFKNTTLEPQVPMFFTEAFSRELAASGLVNVNKPGADATLQGSVVSVSTTLSTLSGQGLATGKTVTVSINLSLVQQGRVIAGWSFGDSEAYDASTINSEDYNRRAALTRLAERMARRFHAQLVAALRA